MTDARRPHPPRRPATSTCSRSPGATACCSSAAAVGLAGRGRRGAVCRSREADAAARRASRSTTRSASPAPGRWPSARSRTAPARPPSWSIPEVVWGRADDGTRWVTTIAAPSARRRPTSPPPPGAAAPRAVVGRPSHPARPAGVVVRARGPRHQGDARRTGGRPRARSCWPARCWSRPTCPFDRAVVLERLRPPYPGCFLFHVDGFVGASPELLVSRTGDVVRAQPMAGTAPRGGDPAADARLAASLLASPTYRHEHQITIDMVFDTLLALVLVPRLRARAVGGRRRQRAAPRHHGRGPALAAGAVGPRAGGGPPPDARRSTAGPATTPAPGSRSTRASTAAATPAPSAGSTAAATAPSPSASAAPTSTAPRPAWSPATASSPTATPTPSWPRPRSSSKPCSAPSPGSDARRRLLRTFRRSRDDVDATDVGRQSSATASATAALRRWWTSTLAARSVRTTRTWTPPASRAARTAGSTSSTWLGGDAVGRRQRDQVEAVGRAVELLEALGLDGLGLREEREDAAAVVVDDDDHQVDAALRRRRAGRCCRGGRPGRR